jgi:drug/metabolite transporter (DMT)-like permease
MMKIAVLLTLTISLTVVANLLMKLGAADQRSVMLLRLISWRTGLGLGTFAGAAALYSLVLRILPLNVAQSLAAAQFIAVILASTIVLGEVVSVQRWLGVAMISGGIVIVALSYK